MRTTVQSVYVLQSPYGFLSDSEWDGDSYTASPLSAWQYTAKPENSICAVRKVDIRTIYYDGHLPAEPQKVSTQKGIKYKCKCPRCGRATNNYVDRSLAVQRYLEMASADCLVQSWKYSEEDAKWRTK